MDAGRRPGTLLQRLGGELTTLAGQELLGGLLLAQNLILVRQPFLLFAHLFEALLEILFLLAQAPEFGLGFFEARFHPMRLRRLTVEAEITRNVSSGSSEQDRCDCDDPAAHGVGAEASCHPRRLSTRAAARSYSSSLRTWKPPATNGSGP